MHKTPHILWFLIPGAVFLGLMAFMVISIPRPQTSMVEVDDVKIIPTIVSQIFPQPVSPLESLIQEISSFQVDDPTLAPPPFDREINLPEE